MNNKLKEYFPIIRTREQILQDIEAEERLKKEFDTWKEKT